MNNKLLTAVLVLAALVAGWLLGNLRTGSDEGGSTSTTAEREILYWKAPMDPSYRRDGPGKSPMGMDLVPVYADDVDDDASVVSIDPAVVNNLGVRTATAERRSLPRQVETVGYVGYDEETMSQVNTRVDGWIESLAVKAEGDPVARGQLLFELYSPTLVNAQEEFLATLASSTPRLANAARDRLAALGVGASDIERLERERRVRQRMPVHAAADGFVASLGVREGAYVTPGTTVLEIAGLGSVWVHAEVLERQSAWVEPGQHADVVLEHRPEARWEGVVDYVYPELDPVTRTLKLRLRIDNADRSLRPNLFARVTVHAAGTGPVVSIPREALIRGGRADRVVVALGGGRFRSQPVEPGIESGGYVEIRRGLAAGERVVTSGQFLIDSESNMDTALDRLSDTSDRDSGHDGMDHGSMNHDISDGDAMDHGTMDHATMGDEDGADEGMDHGSMNHDMSDGDGMDHGTMDHATMGDDEGARESMDHGSMNHDTADSDPMDHGDMDHGSSPPGDGDRADEHEGHRP